MSLCIVPNEVRDAINAAIDKELNGRPIEAEEREHVFLRLLDLYDELGRIPVFTLTANDSEATQ
jgi:hypothetical protein